MKRIVPKAVLLLYALMGLQCGSSVFDKLQGSFWVDKDDIEHNAVDGIVNTEPPDFIFFHKSGRYIILNDLEGMRVEFPMVERGNWSVKDNNKIVLVEDWDGTISIKDGKQFLKDYKKIPAEAVRMERLRGNIGGREGFGLPFVKSVLLKLTYHSLSPGAVDGSPAEITMEDQEGHALWKKKVLFYHQQKTEEIFLADIIADRPAIIDQDKLVFKVDCKFGWVLKVKLYGAS
jgi:hypothetical protein